MNRQAKFALSLTLCLLGSWLASAQPDGLTYKSGFSSITKLGKDLWSRLSPRDREMLSSSPVSIDSDPIPSVRMLYENEQPRPVRGVWISAGFIDLVNQIAHAKSIDAKQKGYFNKYIEQLSRETGEKELQPLPNDSNPAFWSDDMLNEQLSNFNSIVGIVVGVNLAHHYLGLYDKYKDKLIDARGKAVPINNLLTPEEWENAMNHGLRNALDAGCLIEGALPFFEAFDKMQARPVWASFFVPDNVKSTKMRRNFQKVQRDYLEGH